MNRGAGAGTQNRGQGNANADVHAKPPAAVVGGRCVEPDTMLEQSHTASEECILHECYRNRKMGCKLRHSRNPLR
jgi:hypothetical protein